MEGRRELGVRPEEEMHRVCKQQHDAALLPTCIYGTMTESVPVNSVASCTTPMSDVADTVVASMTSAAVVVRTGKGVNIAAINSN